MLLVIPNGQGGTGRAGVALDYVLCTEIVG